MNGEAGTWRKKQEKQREWKQKGIGAERKYVRDAKRFTIQLLTTQIHVNFILLSLSVAVTTIRKGITCLFLVILRNRFSFASKIFS